MSVGRVMRSMEAYVKRPVFSLGLIVAALVVAAVAAGCSGAQDQDVLSSTVGSSTSGNGTSTSGATSGGTSGTTSGGTSGTTSGGTSGTTSGSVGNCVEESSDSTEAKPLKITTCANGAFQFPRDQEDWLELERPKNAKFSINWTGPVAVLIWDERGQSYEIKDMPNKEGTYLLQLQYDFKRFPLQGNDAEKVATYPWTLSIGFQ